MWIFSGITQSIKIYQLISKIDGNQSDKFLWLSISAIKRLILSILIEKYRKDKNGHSPSSLARTDKQQLETDIKVNKHIYKTLFALLISTLRICTACAQMDRKHNHKSNNVTWLVSFSVMMSCSFQQILVLPLNKSTAVPLASSASNGKKMGKSSQICDHRFLSIIITNQLRNIEYYRVLRPDKGLH